MISPHKNRSINWLKPVKVYKNLHRGCWSIVQGSQVVAHADTLCMRDCRFVVRKRGRERCLREGKKNVHAFCIGWMQLNNGDIEKYEIPIHYEPFKIGCFYTTIKEVSAVKAAKHVLMTENGKVFGIDLTRG